MYDVTLRMRADASEAMYARCRENFINTVYVNMCLFYTEPKNQIDV